VFTSDAECNEQQPTEINDRQKVTDIDLDVTECDDVAVTDDKVCRHLSSSIYHLLFIIFCLRTNRCCWKFSIICSGRYLNEHTSFLAAILSDNFDDSDTNFIYILSVNEFQ